VLAIMVVPPFSTLKPDIYTVWGTGKRLNCNPLSVLTPLSHPLPTDPPHLGHNPRPTKHIMLVIMLFPPFLTLRPGIYQVGETDEQEEPRSFYPFSPHCHILYHKTPHSWVATPGPRCISCRQLYLFPLFLPSTLMYIGRGILLNRENHPPFARLDPADTSSTAKSPTVESRPRDHEDIVLVIMFVPPFSTLKPGI